MKIVIITPAIKIADIPTPMGFNVGWWRSISPMPKPKTDGVRPFKAGKYVNCKSKIY